MKIAILGATSQIAKDLIISFSEYTDYECVLFSRDVARVDKQFLDLNIKISYLNLTYESFSEHDAYDVIINFVGVGDPAAAKKMGADIFAITEHYDNLALNYLKVHPGCKYIFISSGAVYGGSFETPVNENTQATVTINNLKETDWYAIAKLYAEAKHRALSDYSIIDVRVFNYFSHTQDMNTRFLITDIVRAIQMKEVFKTSPENIVRDFITPDGFFDLVQAIIKAKPTNIALDCYTKSPVEKLVLLSELESRFGLPVEISDFTDVVNATGSKLKYFSLNKIAEMIGYAPQKTSLEGIVEQLMLIDKL
ncbi:NAD-dependent epimerase/dehydratase family protein [Thiomicrorhabdus arctica]|uniref:NAD-dependent epimerase/dehydratase family protein n=1 Tax=Thiomicrorhabdus arctica TaxID=131540 RepID=UPI0003683395|nr:NAD-dependent epimerase/dehydratase family protein [Thiomicrorhabdus arctica]